MNTYISEYYYRKYKINKNKRLKHASFPGTVSKGKDFGRRLIALGSLLRFCFPMAVDAIAFNSSYKAIMSRFPVRHTISWRLE